MKVIDAIWALYAGMFFCQFHVMRIGMIDAVDRFADGGGIEATGMSVREKDGRSRWWRCTPWSTS